MRIYLAGRFSRREELLGYASELQEAGHEVTSRWLAMHDNPRLTREIELARDSIDPGAATFAIADHVDVRRAEALVAFTEPVGDQPFAGRGGRHVEIGWAQEWGKRVLVIGGIENAAHELPAVVHIPAWDLTQVRAGLAAASGPRARFGLGVRDVEPRTIFLAGVATRHSELAGLAAALSAAGLTVLPAGLQNVAGGRSSSAFGTWHDVRRAATFVAVSETPVRPRGADRGLRHVMFGWAQAAGRRLIVWGPRENIMHALPGVEHAPGRSLEALLAMLEQPVPTPLAQRQHLHLQPGEVSECSA